MKRRLLVVELHHLGDAVMSLPFVRGARELFEVHVLCRPSVAAVYRLLPQPPHLHEWQPLWAEERECGAAASVLAAHKQGRTLRAQHFDTAVSVWADARVEILMAATAAAQRLGFPMTRSNYYAANLPWRARNLWAGRLLEKIWSWGGPNRPLLTTWLHRATKQQHHLRCWEQLAEAAGFECDYSSPWVDAEPSEEMTALKNRAAAAGKAFLALHTHARQPSKQWPAEKWRALGALPAVRARFELCEVVPPGREPHLPEISRCTTPDVAALASALAACDALVGHDSFPAHLAAASGKPVVTIFGSGEPDWFAPWNNRGRVVQRRVCPLHPCIDRCGMDSYLCLDAISVDDVAAEVMRLA